MGRPVTLSVPTNTPEGKALYMKKWWKENKHKKRVYASEYHARNKERNNTYSREYYYNNREERRAMMKEYVKNNKEKLLPGWQKHYHKRRAKLAGVASEPYTKEEIMEKYNGFCTLCHKVIDILLKWPHPSSFSYDHAIPLSKGGNDTVENVNPTHLKCNLSKFTKVMEINNG